MAKRRLFVDAQGNATGVFAECIGNAKKLLGDMHIVRASNIEFCNKRKVWSVTMPVDPRNPGSKDTWPEVCTGETHVDAVAKEIAIINKRLKDDLCLREKTQLEPTPP